MSDTTTRAPVWLCGGYISADEYDAIVAEVDAAPEWTPETIAKLRVLLRPDPVKPAPTRGHRSTTRTAGTPT